MIKNTPFSPDELNEAQQEAVLSTEGPHLVIAGAGSGKTRVLVYRTAQLIKKGISPERILLLTFTRRAAAEMLERASALLDDRCQKVSGGTFHSFANATLRKNAVHLGLSPRFTILDQEDAENVVDLVCKQLGYKKVDKRFPKKAALLSIISQSVNKCIDIESILYDEYAHFAEWSGHINRIHEEYEKYKRAMSLFDYDDLLVGLYQLLADHPQVRQKLSQQYQYIMVDEYQDTNKIQARIVQLLASEHQNVMVVGDDSQSIYSFRGAHFRNILEFPKTFAGAKVIVLEENYRSCQPILDLTNEVINSASEKFEKALFTKRQSKTRPVYVDVLNENGQSKYIVRKILDLKQQGVPLHEMAVLFRSGWHSNDLEIELASYGIPFVKYGGQKFVETAHVKDILSYLRVAYNMHDEVSWSRILLSFPGIGAKSASDILEEVIRQRKGLDISEKFLEKRAQLRQLFTTLKKVDAAHQPPVELLKTFLAVYQPIFVEQYDDYDRRISDLESLERIISRYDSLEHFLADMTLDPLEKTVVARQAEGREENLIISTIHSAKGLEWHTVFVIYVAEGYLPSYRSFNNEQAIEEERRLFYVATTRAKENLFLLRPQIDNSPRVFMDGSGSMYTRVSRFLEEGDILRKFVKIESDYHGSAKSWNAFQ